MSLFHSPQFTVRCDAQLIIAWVAVFFNFLLANIFHILTVPFPAMNRLLVEFYFCGRLFNDSCLLKLFSTLHTFTRYSKSVDLQDFVDFLEVEKKKGL